MYLKFDGTSVALSGPTNGLQQWATGAGQTLSGADLNDLLGAQSNDVLIGGGGDNQYYLTGSGNLIVQGPTGVNTVTALVSYTLPDNIQNLNVSGSGGLYAAGNSLDNLVIVGNGQNMQLYGAAGDDVLVGGSGNDVFIIKGGEGNDALYNWHAGDQIRLEGPTSLHSFADVHAAMRQQGSDVVIQNGTTAFVVRNAAVSQFAATDFHFTRPPNPTLDIAGPPALHEGDFGSTDFAFTVTRSGDLSASTAVDYYRAYGGTADSSDFAGFTAGTVYFGAGQSQALIHIAVAGDTAVEPDKSFVIALANARQGTIGAGSAWGDILNDDAAATGSLNASSNLPSSSSSSGEAGGLVIGSAPATTHGDILWSNNDGNRLLGGTGDDVFHLGRGGDMATGGGGNDTFAFAENPWSSSGHITDFNAGDVIDLTATLQKAGYVYGDPVAEGYLKFAENAQHNAEIWFNPDPNGAGAYWVVTSLDGISGLSLHANAGLITL